MKYVDSASKQERSEEEAPSRRKPYEKPAIIEEAPFAQLRASGCNAVALPDCGTPSTGSI